MILCIPNVIAPDDVDEIRHIADGLTWGDGARTAGKTAARVKRNEQADLSSGAGRILHERLLAAVAEHPMVRAAARPARYSKLLLSRSDRGGGYGAHVDNALMGSGKQRIRTDLSFTLFLTDPAAYEGGELDIDRPGLTQSFKGEPGELVLYPSSSIHRVAPVTSGSRLVCVGWIQSLVRDASRREVLWDLENLRVALRGQHDRNSIEMLTLSKSLSNLLRMWSEG